MKKHISLLLVEDDEDDYVLTTAVLNDIPNTSFQITWADNYKIALQKLSSETFDICMFDFRLGAKTGLDLLREARDLEVEAPIILLTGKGATHIDEEATRLGATDYLIKNELQPESLERSIRYALKHAAVLKALKESEHKYRGIFEDSIDVIYLLDENGLFTDISPSVTLLLGYKPHELKGRPLVSLFASNEARLNFQYMQNTKANIRDIEVDLISAHDTRRFCILTSTFHPPEDDRPGYFQGFIHDITQRKKAEQQLLIAEKLAATGRFVRMLGHEIRNPLTNINLAVEQIIVENQDEELNDYLSIIKRNSLRIGNLVDNLLRSANPGTLDFQQCAAQDVLDQVMEVAIDRIRLKDIQLQKNYEQNPAFILADEEKLRIALFNIVINAIEVVDQSRGVIRLTIQTNEEHCIISIGDNGHGITPEHLGRIFDPYFSKKSNGLGLGLATTLNIVQSHKGRIDVRSEVGKGTEFTVYLPLANLHKVNPALNMN